MLRDHAVLFGGLAVTERTEIPSPWVCCLLTQGLLTFTGWSPRSPVCTFAHTTHTAVARCPSHSAVVLVTFPSHRCVPVPFRFPLSPLWSPGEVGVEGPPPQSEHARWWKTTWLRPL